MLQPKNQSLESNLKAECMGTPREETTLTSIVWIKGTHTCQNYIQAD